MGELVRPGYIPGRIRSKIRSSKKRNFPRRKSTFTVINKTKSFIKGAADVNGDNK
jgi:hypothetical protein